jgi:hypothetical protein
MNTYIPIPCSFFDQWSKDGGYYDIRHAILDVVYLKANKVFLSPEELMKRWRWRKPNVKQEELLDLVRTIWTEIPELPVVDSDGITESSKLSLYLNNFNKSVKSIADGTGE